MKKEKDIWFYIRTTFGFSAITLAIFAVLNGEAMTIQNFINNIESTWSDAVNGWNNQFYSSKYISVKTLTLTKNLFLFLIPPYILFECFIKGIFKIHKLRHEIKYKIEHYFKLYKDIIIIGILLILLIRS